MALLDREPVDEDDPTPVRRIIDREWDDLDWQADAACTDADTDLFFAAFMEPDDERLARESFVIDTLCAHCGVRAACREFGRRHREFGIWGETEEQRARAGCAPEMATGRATLRRWISDSSWRWHVWHWRIQIPFVGKVKRLLFERCMECGRRYPWGYAPVSHQWDTPPAKWFRVQRRAYHHECSSLVSSRHTISTDERLIRSLFAAFRSTRDLGEPEALALLTDPKARSMEFGDAYRLTRILGYERNDNYELVRAGGPPVSLDSGDGSMEA